MKKINKEATIQEIRDWANKSIGNSINVSKFNANMGKSDWERSLKKMAKFCQVEVVYHIPLSSLNPKSGEWYFAKLLPNKTEELVYIDENGHAAYLTQVGISYLESLYDARKITKDEATAEYQKLLGAREEEIKNWSEEDQERNGELYILAMTSMWDHYNAEV